MKDHNTGVVWCTVYALAVFEGADNATCTRVTCQSQGHTICARPFSSTFPPDHAVSPCKLFLTGRQVIGYVTTICPRKQ